MIVHVEQNKVSVTPENKCSKNNDTTRNHGNKLQFELHITIGIYVSRSCSEAIQQDRERRKDKTLSICKLSNITSSRRMISAVHNLERWPQHRRLLKPMIDDPYFQLPDDYETLNLSPNNGFNEVQSKAITIAESMFEDIKDHLHLVHGPPGMLHLFLCNITSFCMSL